MKRFALLSAVALTGTLVAAPALADDDDDGQTQTLQAGTYQIDTGHTYAHFTVDHMGLSTMHGRMDVTEGTLQIGKDRSGSQVQVTLDPASVDTGDDKRDEHLRDMEGFFNTQKFPKITFQSTDVMFGDDDGDEAKVEGKLTMHGVTRPVTLDVDDMSCQVNPLDKSKYTCGFNATTSVERSDFGMNAYAALVGDEIEISLEVEADKPVEDDAAG